MHRADGSGTSFIFTNYLSKVNADWKSKVGEGTAVNWPGNGVGGKGNEGVAQYVQRLPNSIGYVEYAYAKQNKMDYVQLKNSAGAFVSRSIIDATRRTSYGLREPRRTVAQRFENSASCSAISSRAVVDGPKR